MDIIVVFKQSNVNVTIDLTPDHVARRHHPAPTLSANMKTRLGSNPFLLGHFSNSTVGGTSSLLFWCLHTSGGY